MDELESADLLQSSYKNAELPQSSYKNAELPQTSYKKQECVLYGVVSEASKLLLLQRLNGLCDPDKKKFFEHEMVFLSSVKGITQFVFKMRRRLNADATYWHARYVGIPENDPNCPTIVRKIIDSCIYSPKIINVIKVLGLKFDYEYLMEGSEFTKDNIKITVSKISYTEKTGYYAPELRKELTSSYLVEVSSVIPENQDYVSTAKAVREFADNLYPLCELQKYDYTKE